MKQKQQNRLTWGGLIRTLARRPVASYDKEHIKLIMHDGSKHYVNIKYDAYRRPYFVEVKYENRRTKS